MKDKNFALSTKGEKIFRYINIALDAAIMLTAIGLAIAYKLGEDPNGRFAASLGLLIVGVIPFLYELIFRTKLPNSVFLIFNLYFILAGLWGSALSGYLTFAWLDIVVHFVMGYLMAMLGLFIICRTSHQTKMHFLLIALFCLAFSLLIECAWEIYEWVASIVANTRLQGEFVEGFSAPLVTDTMEDICCNFGGAALFALHYLISKWTRKNLFISSMEKEFSVKHKLFENSKLRKNKQAEKDENLTENNEK